MTRLDETLKELKTYLVEKIEADEAISPKSEYRKKDDYGYFNGTRTKDLDADIARMRLDWELSFDAVEDGKSQEAIADLMIASIKADLEDLIENGDVNEYSDALLKTFDGSKKRGKEVKEVDIFSASLFWERKEKKKMVEYTLYILMYVKWE